MENKLGVIFDMDGVIVDSNPAHKKSIDIFCENHNRKLSEQFLRTRVYGRTNKEWIPEVFGDITSKRSNQLANEKEEIFRDIFDPRSSVIPGLYDFLGQLKARKIKSAIATSAEKENAEFILSELSIEDYFDAVLDSTHVDKGKPEPDIYIKASNAIDCDPEKCIIFEDSLAGVEAGKRAGANVIGITSTHTPDQLKNCDKVVNNFKEVSVEELTGLFHI